MTNPDPSTRGRRQLGDRARMAAAIAARPVLWPTALAQAARVVPPGWWRRPPFLPRPDAAYLRFRLATQYGDARVPPEPADVVTYLEWCRQMARIRRRGLRTRR